MDKKSKSINNINVANQSRFLDLRDKGMKYLAVAMVVFLFSLKQTCVFSQEPIISITSTYTMAMALNSIRSALDEAFKKQGIDPQSVDIKYVPHYDVPKSLQNGDIILGGRAKSDHYVQVAYRLPELVIFRKKTFGESLDLTPEKLKKILTDFIEEKDYGTLGRPLSISTGAVSGHTKHALAYYAELSYPRLKQTGERLDIASTDDQFVHRSIKDQGYDLVAVPFAQDKLIFHVQEDSDIGVATANGLYPNSKDYPINSYIFHASFNGSDPRQKKISTALNDPLVKKELEKVGVYPIEEDREAFIKKLKETHPDHFGREHL